MIDFKFISIPVTTSATTVFLVSLSGNETQLLLDLSNTASHALVDFRIDMELSRQLGDLRPYLGGSDFAAANPAKGVRWVSEQGPQDLPAGANCQLSIDILPGTTKLALVATADTGGTTLNGGGSAVKAGV